MKTFLNKLLTIAGKIGPFSIVSSYYNLLIFIALACMVMSVVESAH